MIYRVSLIGHRRIDNQLDLEEKLHKIVVELLRSKEYVEFYIGRNGEFDIIAASVIKRAQKAVDYNNSSVVLVLPYRVKDMEYYENYYDELTLPIEPKTHFKEAIIKRNKWLVDNTDMLIAFVENSKGGAYQCLEYAKKAQIDFINIVYWKNE